MPKSNLLVSRRDLIKALGVTGVLSVNQVERALAQSGTAPLRVLLVALQHGWGISGGSNRAMAGTEHQFTFPNGLDPFNTIKQECVVIDGLLTLGLWGNNHDLSYADMFTAGVPQGQESSAFESHMPLSATPSLDYLLEQHSGKPCMRFSAGYRSWGLQYHPVSLDHNSNVLPFFTRASDAYNSLFADLPDSGTGATSPELEKEALLIEQLFQVLRAPAERRINVIHGDEQAKLESYLLALHDVRSKKQPEVGYSGNIRVAEIPERSQSQLQNLTSYLDMIKVGFANNLSTSAVLGIGDIHSIEKFHHDHAHGNTDTWWQTRRHFATEIAAFANQLANIIDFDGNRLLDNTIIVLTGEVGDGGHNVINKGHIVIGGGAHLQTGRYLAQNLVQGASNIQSLMREDVNGTLQRQITFGNQHTQQAGSRTNADLLREIGNLAGLSLAQFGLPSQNKGDVL